MSENIISPKHSVNPHETFESSLERTSESSEKLSQMLKANQAEASQEKLAKESEESAAEHPIRHRKAQKNEKASTKIEKTKETSESKLVRKEDADSMADQFANRDGNKEYHLDAKMLSELAFEELGLGINETTNPDVIIENVRRRMSRNEKNVVDPSFLDKGLEFLLEVTSTQLATATAKTKERLSKIYDKIKTAKEQHFQANEKSILVDQKIIGAADAITKESSLSIKESLDECRYFVHEQPDIQLLRKKFEIKGYKTMMFEFKSLSEYLGTNFKRENLERGEIGALFDAVRKMRALIQVHEEGKRQLKSFIPGYFNANHLFNHL